MVIGYGLSYLSWALGSRDLVSIPSILCGPGQPLAFSEPLFPPLRIMMKMKSEMIKIKSDMHKNCLVHSLANRHLIDVDFTITNCYHLQCTKHYAEMTKPC